MANKNTTRQLDKEIVNKPSDSWPNFAHKYLFQFFEGQNWTVWFFVSGLLIILYGKFAIFKDNYIGNILEKASLVFLFLLIGLTLLKNITFRNYWNLGEKIRNLIKQPIPYRNNRWLANVSGLESQKLDLPIKIINFKKIYSEVNVLDAGDGRWRAGFVFNSIDGKKEYIFHAYQDKGQSVLRARIVEREPNIREVPGDINKQVGIKNPHNFRFWVETDDKKLVFYIDGIKVGSYKVPLRRVNNIQISAWSDEKPIKVLFQNTEIQA